MSTAVSTQVTPELHPDNVKSIEGYDEVTRQVLGMTETAFDAAYKGVINVVNAREKAKTNPTWNEAQQFIHTQEYADKVMTGITKGFDNARNHLVKGIRYLEGELNLPLTEKASSAMGAEIRAHVKAMTTSERQKFLEVAIDNGDEETVAAVLGAKPYLSGVTAGMQQTLTHFWHVKMQPEKAARLKVMQGARNMIEKRAGLVFREMEKAVGMRPDRVRALRNAKTEAEKAFLLKDA